MVGLTILGQTYVGVLCCHPVVFQRCDLSFHLKNKLVTKILLLHHSTYTEYHMLARCKILIIIMSNSTNTNLILENNGIVSLLGCSCWLAKSNGAVSKDGLLSLCVHSSTVLSSKVLTYSVKMSAIINEPISFELTIFFSSGTIFGLGNTIFILSFPNLVTAWNRPKFSLKCIAASSNLKMALLNGYMCLFELAYLQYIPTYKKPSSLGAKWLTTL